MGERVLRIVAKIGSVAHLGVCAKCGQPFRVPSGQAFTAESAIAILQAEFEKHECKQEGVSPLIARLNLD